MKVGFDARDVLRPRTGVANHALHLLEALAGCSRGHALLPYVDRRDDGRSPKGVRLRAIPGPPGVWKHVSLPIALVADRVDLFHSPSGTLPLWSPCPAVVTVHDLFAEIEPSWFPARVGLQLRYTMRRACRVARRILAVSEATKGDIARFYGVPRERIHVVHNGVDVVFRPLDDTDAQRAVRERYLDGAPFILYVGSRFPWRNLPRLIEAFGRLKRRRALPGHRLLIVGRDIWGMDPSPALVQRLELKGEVRFAGYVQPQELPALYRAAEALAYPSLYEGFGIPPLEAMACGTPVLTSTRGGLAEVVGDAALVVEPEDVEALASGLERVVLDDPLRQRLRAMGLARANLFSWERAAEQTWEVYEAAGCE